mgnify:CR=1 FL=1
MLVNQFLILAAVLFCIGVYGVIARRNAVMVLMSIELILNSVNINFLAFALRNGSVDGHVFALYIIAVAAAEVGVTDFVSSKSACFSETEAVDISSSVVAPFPGVLSGSS